MTARANPRLRSEEGEDQGEPIVFHFENEPVHAFAGESLATALLAAGIRRLRSSPRAGTPRGLFCAMATCQECVVIVQGHPVPACRERVRAGMRVTAKRYS